MTITETTCITEVPEKETYTEIETIIPKDRTTPEDITVTGTIDVTPTVEIETYTFETIPTWTDHPVTEESY